MAKGLNFLTTKVYLVPLEDLESLTSPSIADIVTGFDISGQLLPATKLPVYGDDKTVVESSITEGEDIEALAGLSTTGWNLTMFHDFTSAGVYSGTDLTTIFTSVGMQWALVYRIGLPHSTALAATQKVSVWPVTSGAVQKILDFQGYFKAKINLYNLGNSEQDVALVV
jgi:hypothetical protein